MINKFKVAVGEEAADNWPICWTGQEQDGKHYNVTTNKVTAFELNRFSQGAAADAALIAKLLNWYYTDQEEAEKIIAS